MVRVERAAKTCPLFRKQGPALNRKSRAAAAARAIPRSGSGGVGQLGARLLCKQEVIGSIPFTSTMARFPEGAGDDVKSGKDSFFARLRRKTGPAALCHRE